MDGGTSHILWTNNTGLGIGNRRGGVHKIPKFVRMSYVHGPPTPARVAQGLILRHFPLFDLAMLALSVILEVPVAAE